MAHAQHLPDTIVVTFTDYDHAENYYYRNPKIEDSRMVLTPVALFDSDVCVIVDLKAKRPKPRHYKKATKQVIAAWVECGYPAVIQSGILPRGTPSRFQ